MPGRSPPFPPASASAIRRWMRGGLPALALAAIPAGVASHAPSVVAAWCEQHAGTGLDAAGSLACAAALALGAAGGNALLGSRREIAAWRRAHLQARSQATRDPLTGLPNRRRLRAELALALARVRRGRAPVCLMILNLDRFRAVNERHGQRAGDLLLRAVGDRILGTVRRTDVVAHLGGDEFALMGELRQGEDASVLAERLATELRLPFPIGAVELRISCRIGIAVAPQDGDDPESLVQRAALALARAGQGRREGGQEDARSGRTAVARFFDPELERRAQRRDELHAALGSAIASGRIVPHYQPIVDLASRRIRGFEALARWWQPPRGLVPPSEFIPAAEATGLIGQLTDAVLRQACAAARNWPEPLSVSVNLSPSQLQDAALPARVAAILAETGLAPARLELEVAEAALAEHLEPFRVIAPELRALGVRLALDDLGAGPVGLRHLHAVRFDRIKVDAGFVRSIGVDRDAMRALATMIEFAASIGIAAVAEGVETEAEADFMARLGCEAGQGWWFGRPIPAAGVGTIFARPG